MNSEEIAAQKTANEFAGQLKDKMTEMLGYYWECDLKYLEQCISHSLIDSQK